MPHGLSVGSNAALLDSIGLVQELNPFGNRRQVRQSTDMHIFLMKTHIEDYRDGLGTRRHIQSCVSCDYDVSRGRCIYF